MKKWRLVIIILVIVLVLVLSQFFGLIKPVKNTFWRAISPVGTVFKVSFSGIPKFFGNIFYLKQIVNQNHDLVVENLKLQSEMVNLKEISYENEILKKELNFAQTQNNPNTLIPVSIIGRTSGYLKAVTIDKGTNAGLSNGQIVISQGFIVGAITQIRAENADVTLITDYNSLIPVVLQDSRGTGLIRGGLNGLVVEDIPLNTTVKFGENVLTSGLGGQIPAGLAVGKTREVISKAGEIFQKVTVVSPIDFSNLEVLFVVKK